MGGHTKSLLGRADRAGHCAPQNRENKIDGHFLRAFPLLDVVAKLSGRVGAGVSTRPPVRPIRLGQMQYGMSAANEHSRNTGRTVNRDE